MELAAVDVAALNRGGQLSAVLGGRGDAVGTVGGVVGMDEVDAVALFDIFEQLAVFFEKQGVPADVGYLQIGIDDLRYRSDLAADQSEPLVLAVLAAFVKKELHPEANAHNGLA